MQVIAIFKQMPVLLTALKTKPDPNAPGGVVYDQAPNHDAQVGPHLPN